VAKACNVELCGGSCVINVPYSKLNVKLSNGLLGVMAVLMAAGSCGGVAAWRQYFIGIW